MDFRSVMRSVAFPVAVLCVQGRYMTVSSLTSVSLNPSIISFALQDTSKMCLLLKEQEKLLIHLLSTNQSVISEKFARPSKIETLDVKLRHINDQPVLDGCLSVMDAIVFQKIKMYDHTVFFAETKNIMYHSPELKPLLYRNRVYTAPID